MKLSRRANTIILWVVSIGLLLGMVITFTPSLGLGTGGAGQLGAVALRVNGEPIHELEIAQARSNPLFASVSEGEVGEDLDLLLVDTVIRQELVRQDSARLRVSDGDVRTAVNEFRVSRGVEGRGNDDAYLRLIGGSGFNDETFRDYLREQLRQQRWEASIVEGVEVTDEEVTAYFEGNRDAYVSEERIEARHLVTESLEAATEARDRILAGEDAATVATEVSVERADRGGALGAAAGETTPRPVGRPALPTAVATAAFGLQGEGVTEVVETDGRFHVVVVEAYLPSEPRPFEEVADVVRDDALAAKQAGVLEAAVNDLVEAARIEIPDDSLLTYQDEPVARVGDAEILRSQVVRATYTNPQIQQALSPDNAVLITAFFKPAIQGQLVDQELAIQGAEGLGVPFIGPRSLVAQSALAYVARDAEVEEADVVAYYEQNQQQFTVPASAVTVRVDLASLEDAAAYRARLLEGADYVEAGAEFEAGVEELGTVRPGQLEDVLDTTLFGTDAFEPVPGTPWEVSDVLALTDEVTTLPESVETDAEGADAETAAEPETTLVERYVVLVAERTPERVRPLEEVRGQVTDTVLAQQRAELRNAWLDELRAEIPVQASLVEATPPAFELGDPALVDPEAVDPVVLEDAGEPEAEPDADPAPAAEETPPAEETPAPATE